MIKEKMAGVIGYYDGRTKNILKLDTALAWIRCAQKGKSPIDRLREKQIKQIVVYGITELGELLIEEAYEKQYKILAITDQAVREGGYEYRGIPIIRRQDVGKYSGEVFVVTSMTFWEEIKDELHAEGCRRVMALRELL